MSETTATASRPWTKAKRGAFAIAAVALALIVSLGGLLAADLYEHHHMAMNAGLNVWGYRGPVVGRKKAGERRVVVVGESTAFGYGVHWDESFPAYLEQMINRQRRAGSPPITVVNLAYNNEGAHSYKFTLGDYEYLDYDAVVFYSGYNDLGVNLNVFRHASPFFRAFGYMPILPLVLHEKALSLQYGGRLNDAYLGKKVIFKPNGLQRATATMLHAFSDTMDSVERPVKSEGLGIDHAETTDGAACGVQWAQYCGAMYQAVKLALDRHRPVLIASQPRLGKEHGEQQTHLVAFLRQQFGDTPLLHFVDLSDVVNLHQASALNLDGLHLTPAGNQVIAGRLTKTVAGMLE